MQEVAGLRPATITAAQSDKEEPGTTKAVQAVRNLMSMFNLAMGTNVGSDGYRVQCRHGGQACTILWVNSHLLLDFLLLYNGRLICLAFFGIRSDLLCNTALQ